MHEVLDFMFGECRDYLTSAKMDAHSCSEDKYLEGLIIKVNKKIFPVNL